MEGKRKYLNIELLMPIILAAFVVLFVLDVLPLSRITKRFPLIVGSVTLFFLIIQTYLSIKIVKAEAAREGPEPWAEKTRPAFLKNKAVLLLAAMVLYAAGIYLLGFYISTPIVFALIMWIIGERKITRILFVTAGFMAVFYLVFVKLFTLQPPSGALW
jgi:hypothetical protein